MLTSFVLNLFLYFPEDKSEYIPAAITMAIFFGAAIGCFFFIKKISRKEELKTKELMEQIKREEEPSDNR
jgi:preprotein translocase subunit YajC